MALLMIDVSSSLAFHERLGVQALGGWGLDQAYD